MERPKRSRALVVSVTGHRNLGRTSRRVARGVSFRVHSAAREISHAQIRRHIAAGGGRGSDRGAHCRRSAGRTAGRPRFRCRSTTPKATSRTSQRASKEFKRMLGKADEIFLAPLRSRGSRWRAYKAAREKQYASGRSLCRGTRRHACSRFGMGNRRAGSAARVRW